MVAPLKPFTLATGLCCSACGKIYSLSSVHTWSPCCHLPLLVSFNTTRELKKSGLSNQSNSMWRYSMMLPILAEKDIVSLGEGMTPLFSLEKLADAHGFSNLLLKDESCNPTGSFKARGISVAVSKAKEFKIEKCIIPTAGNAGGALAAYCAKAGIKCTVVMPRHTPDIFKQECEVYGADLVLVDGLINDCAKKVGELNKDADFFDMSTLKEPYRLEGKKTMGYEIAEQLNWKLPDVILYPAGGGTGLIGIWKALKEMKELGWIKGKFPRMIAVQASNCAPLYSALKDPLNWQTNFICSPTIANGLAVPYPFGIKLMLNVIKESGGTAVVVDDSEIISAVKLIAKTEGLLISPEGAATWSALIQLRNRGLVTASDKILPLNTGTGYKYLENIIQ